MTDSQQPTGGVGARFVINLVGIVGLVFGALPILRYLFSLEFGGFSDAPYRWLALEGRARYLPPAMVLVVCLAAAYLLERRLDR